MQRTSTTPPPATHGSARSPASRGFILLLVMIAAVSPLGINLYLPSMPGMARMLQVDYASIQLTLSVYIAAIAVGQLIVGPISDRYGRRPVLLGGLATFVVGSAICMLAPNVGTLIAGRVIQALGGCAGIALSRAIVRDLYDRDRAASMIGYVTMGMAVAPMVAPTIGGALELAFDWRAGFAFLTVFGIGTLWATYRWLHETAPRVGEASSASALIRDYGWLLRSRVFWGYALTAGASASAFFAFVGGGAYVVINLMGKTPVEYGMYFALVSVGYMLGNFGSGRYAIRFGPQRMMHAGLVASMGAAFVMAALHAAGLMHPLAFFLPMLVMAMGNGLTLPSCIAGAVSVKPEVAGAASGLAGSIQMGAGAIVAALVGMQLQGSAWPLIIALISCTVVAFLTLRVLVR
ncbi:MAG: multidrug effflux MFS transporter [Burkholderiaceae bacterium]